MEQKFNAITIILLIMLVIRLIVQVILSFNNLISLSFAALYLAAVVGVVLKQKSGSILAGVIVIIDILASAIFTTGAYAFGAVSYDLILGFLAYKEFKQISD
ncbi:MAG: hypothetical protein PHD13_01840 [Methanocellales archaeon]|nr:hypothetical protein [Methanocellales archaeon]MDD3291020.1 hypothetical protein [Methanocellales archaeon]MDD5234905.1 hypothetical protein [Methanocellales archaeon]MDD5484725.1 hypothetical protein [Methanocellales archaeon]